MKKSSLLFTILLVWGIVFFFAGALWAYKVSEFSKTAKSVVGTIREYIYNGQRDVGRRSHSEYLIKFEYVTLTEDTLISTTRSSVGEATKDVNPVGTSVLIYYDSANPYHIQLEAGSFTGSWLFIGGGLFVIALSFWYRKKNHKTTTTLY